MNDQYFNRIYNIYIKRNVNFREKPDQNYNIINTGELLYIYNKHVDQHGSKIFIKNWSLKMTWKMSINFHVRSI